MNVPEAGGTVSFITKCPYYSVFYYKAKGMLIKVTIQRIQKFSAFSLLLKEPS